LGDGCLDSFGLVVFAIGGEVAESHDSLETPLPGGINHGHGEPARRRSPFRLQDESDQLGVAAHDTHLAESILGVLGLGRIGAPAEQQVHHDQIAGPDCQR